MLTFPMMMMAAWLIGFSNFAIGKAQGSDWHVKAGYYFRGDECTYGALHKGWDAPRCLINCQHHSGCNACAWSKGGFFERTQCQFYTCPNPIPVPTDHNLDWTLYTIVKPGTRYPPN